MLEIGRQTRPSLYDLQFDKLPPLVPRDRAFEVPERLEPDGTSLKPLDEHAVRRLAQRLVEQSVEAVAVCLLHGYRNPENERRVGQIFESYLPGVPISLSHEISPEFREYVRASTTVINASIRPIVARYLDNIVARLAKLGVRTSLLIMQSNGGMFSSDAAQRKPVFMVESGPAAGVVAATYLGGVISEPDVISFDMGGTTAKVGVVQERQPKVTKDYQVGATAQAGIGATSASGYPVRTPVIDLVEIGAGGGSIAWIDVGGLLRVGPRSAGADPGPVCYGKGGVEPTVTDANLVLGRINPEYFLGGEIVLDVEAARAAIQSRCAVPLGLTVEQAAEGIIEIANQAMVNALRLVSVQRGYDPRAFSMVAFGGAGPLHANKLMAELSIPRLVIPRGPGLFSALGLLVTNLRREGSATWLRLTSLVTVDEIKSAVSELEQQVGSELVADGVPATDIRFHRFLEMRYMGQSYELSVELPDSAAEWSVESLEHWFHIEHDRAYGHASPGEPVEIVNIRVAVIGKIPSPELSRLPSQGERQPSPKEMRPVYFRESNGYVNCAIYDRYALLAGAVVGGPAIIEEMDSTTVVHPGHQMQVDEFGNLVICKLPGG
jgi:N-methylhydantoinase A